jgi:hypothetical protein
VHGATSESLSYVVATVKLSDHSFGWPQAVKAPIPIIAKQHNTRMRIFVLLVQPPVCLFLQKETYSSGRRTGPHRPATNPPA